MSIASRRELKKRMMCRGCWEQLHVPIFIRGPLALPYRVCGLKPSAMNPNLCTLCETMFKRVMSAPNVAAPMTILFADVRGYTSLSATTGYPEMSRMLGQFYEICGDVVWSREGIVNKLIGDAVLAIFNFPLRREDHVRRAVEAGLELQRRWSALSLEGLDVDGGSVPVGIGVGIHTGEALIGEVGHFLRDFTVIGPAVNLTARLQGAARPGEVLVTEEVRREAGNLLAGAAQGTYELKGLAEPVTAYALTVTS